MCGILGVYPGCNLKVGYLAHRGPDGTGSVILGHIAMGHTRLSILDLSGRGSQPKWSADGNVLLSYNGEIYNYQEFSPAQETSDTAALVELLAKNGPGFNPASLDGMYAFGAYFAKEECLVLCRDPAGIKPLYLAVSPSRKYIAFSSEIKGFFNLEWFSPQPNMDMDVQSDFLQYGYTLPRSFDFGFNNFTAPVRLVATLLANVYQICPGQKIILSLKNAPVSKFTKLPNNLPGDFSDILKMSVKEQSIADVEVGVQLSGGVDSSLVAYNYGVNNPSAHGFYVSVPYAGLNEDCWVEQAAEVIKKICNFTLHRVNANQNEIKRVLPSVIWHMDEPMIRHPNAIGIYLLCEYVRKKTKVEVLLSGEGADELFGGYEWHDGRRLNDYDQSRRLFDLGGSELASSFITRDAGRSILERQLSYDRAFYLPPILARQDRMSMAHSVETRVPFLSNRFFNLPYPDAPGKLVVKEEAAKIFGRDFSARPKCGFGFPWKWLDDFSAPFGSLRWLRVRPRPRNSVQRWALTALGLWAKDYIYGGWKKFI